MATTLMRALKFDSSKGGTIRLKHAEVPVPSSLSKGEILLKLEATSLNPVDFKAYMLKVVLNPLFPRKFPLIPGTDVAGEVVETGPGVENFKVGDKVVAMTSNMGGGGLAEYAVAMEIYTTHRPPELSAAEASGLPIAGLTAFKALTHYAGLKLDPNEPRKNILVTAASGGVGHYAVQLAKLGNIHVTATCGARNVELLKSLGADEVLDYKTPEGASLKSPSGKMYDAVIHCAGARMSWSIFKKNLSENARVIDPSAGGGDMWTYLVQRVTFSKQKLVPFFVAVKAEDLKYLVELMKQGKLKTVIESKYPLSNAGDAWTKLVDGHATGKIIVEQ